MISQQRWKHVVPYLIAAGVTAVATGAIVLLRGFPVVLARGIVYLLIVFGIALLAGTAPAILALALSLVSYISLTIVREGTFGVEHLTRLVTLTLSSAVAIWLAQSARIERERATRLADSNAKLYLEAEDERRKLDAVIDNMVDAVLVVDRGGVLVNANRAALELVGASAEDWVGRTLLEYAVALHVHLPDGALLLPQEPPLAKVLSGERFSDYRISFRTAQGESRLVSVSGSPVRNDTGDITLAVIIARDITEEALLERDREALARVARALVENLELQPVAQAVVEQGQAVLDVQAIWIWATDFERQRLQLLAHGFPPERIYTAREFIGFDSPSVAVRVAQTGEPAIIQDIFTLGPEAAMTKKTAEAQGVRAFLVVPLRARDRLVGVLAMARALPHRFTEYEMDLASTLADMAAAAILNAQTYEESERRRTFVERIIQNAPMQIVVLSGPEHRISMINPSFVAFVGLPESEILGKRPQEVVPDVVERNLIEVLDRVYRTGEISSATDFELDIGPPRGLVYLTFSMVPLREPGVDLQDVLFLAVEVTEQVRTRQRAEETASIVRELNKRLLATAMRLQTVVEGIADPIMVVDPDGNLTLVNEAMLKLLSLHEPEEILGPVSRYLPKLRLRRNDGRPIAFEETAIFRALHGEVVRNYEQLAFSAAQGRDVYLLVSAAPLQDPTGNITGAVAVVSDITRLKELDQLKDEFISVAAHELKTPVSVLKGYAQFLLRTPGALSEDQKRALEILDKQSTKIDQLVKDLLDISRFRAGRPEFRTERTDLAELARTVVSELAPTTKKHRLIVDVPGPVWVRGDWARLKQVMANLLDNAVKYSPQGGDVLVQLAIRDDRAAVSVTDHGVGIPIAKQEHVFERFFRAHTGTAYDYGGMGVGLYISREIVRGHGGETWFHSEEGKGSTFGFSLPLAGEKEVSRDRCVDEGAPLPPATR